ncbi:unnamed protein product [Darwinula stevensoni]|uniref:AB hydrolase-1 domain-containing protein n=1 Tax=Darwinula stevensoni TaxID=69355 RepID=A0A7R9A396_9CRUS|nr:unnamed protein product [Darwinula stevensoni]CAG0880864.1 unnamed protein product [Darwinula stevensoni]
MSSAGINGRAAQFLLLSRLGFSQRLRSHRFGAFKRIDVRNLAIGREMDEGKAREIYIPVPWGQIAGKGWGSENGRPILALHGWLENAGSFDTLVPLIPDSYHVVAVDMPGNGLSSHYPPGMTYSFAEGPLHIRRILEYLGWSSCTFMGHSGGGAMSMLFAAMFPKMVEGIIVFDLVKPVSTPLDRIVSRAQQHVEEHLRFENDLANRVPPLYTEEEAVNRLIEAVDNSLTAESAKILLKRGARKMHYGDKEGYVYTRDLRHRFPSAIGTVADQHRKFLERIKCPFLLVKGSTGPKYEGSLVHEETLAFYRQNNPHFRYVEVEGSHHVHLNNPEKVAPHVIPFLEYIQEHKVMEANL